MALAPVAAVVAALLNPRLRQELPQWLRSRAAQRAAVLYLLLPLSWWYTQDWPTWRHEVYRQLPLIGVPLAFCLAVQLTGRQRFVIGVAFVGGATLIGLATLARYLFDPVYGQELIRIGQNVSAITGIFHIHFGIMLALAAFLAVPLSQEQWAGRVGRWLLLATGAAAALCLHILAYRTGLLAFYTALAVVALILLFRKPSWAIAIILLAMCLSISAYFGFASVQERVASTLYDLEQFRYGQDINNFSLARRLAAWENARILINERPWLGVAPADVRQAMMEQFSWRPYGLEEKNWVMVHNQYLHYLVGAGGIGLLVWLWVLLTPLFQTGLRGDAYVRYFLLVFGAASMADSLLEMQIGFNLFVFLYGFLVVATERRLTAINVTR